MAQDVLGLRVDPPRLDQRVELCHAHVKQRRQGRHVLAQPRNLAAATGTGVGPVEPGAARPRLELTAKPGAHAHRVAVRVGDQVHPVDPHAQAVGPGPRLEHDRARAVR